MDGAEWSQADREAFFKEHMNLAESYKWRYSKFGLDVDETYVCGLEELWLSILKWETLDGHDNFVAYYLTRYRNRVLMEIRRKATRRETPIPAGLSTSARDSTESFYYTVNKIIDLSEPDLKKREYKKAIIRLKASGYSIAEIAEIIGKHRIYVGRYLNEIADVYIGDDDD